jgi:hypothetical protein
MFTDIYLNKIILINYKLITPNSKMFIKKLKLNFLYLGNLPKQLDMVKEIEEMIDFLLISKYTPYSLDKKLNKTDWKVWSWDIIWKLNDA